MQHIRLLAVLICVALIGMTGKPGMRMAGVGGVTGGGVPQSFVETLLTDTTTRTETPMSRQVKRQPSMTIEEASITPIASQWA